MRDEHILALPMTSDYARLALRVGAARGHGAAAVLAGTGWDEQALSAPDLRMSQRDNLRVLDNLDRLLGPGWPLGLRFGPETSGPLGHAVASAPTVRRAMETLAMFGQSRSPRYELCMPATRAAFGTLEIIETITVTTEQRRTGDEVIMLSLHNMLETLVGDDITAARFHFRSPPPEHAAHYAQALRGSVHFNAGTTCIEFPKEWLDRAAPFANPMLFEAAVRTLEMERTALRAGGLILSEVERVLRSSSGVALPAIGTVATMLGLSTRTLTRRLRDAGTSFRALRNTVQERRARQLLADTDRSIESISAELGYAEPVAFNLACHRWFGMAPRAWRRMQGKTLD